MEYSMEELLPLVEKLTRKYTSNESSSITYETARMLMEAVIYCINECTNNKDSDIVALNEKLDVNVAYQRGYDLIIAKVYKAKEIYESLLENFNDYQCRNCRDTIIKGIPAFFQRYDAKFNPMDHLLTLDYPTIKPLNDLCGVDAIYQYLHNIKLEWIFLNAYEHKSIETLLWRMMPDYKNLYYDNISYTVLLISLGCIIADKSINALELQGEDIEVIQSFFEKDNEEKVKHKIQMLIHNLFCQGFEQSMELEQYFAYTSNDYAIRIENGIKNGSLGTVFCIENTV